MKIAVLGAGTLGVCLALELAKRGLQVDLYDREADCITQAGGRNEGKLHLGFVYGADRSFKTAEKMVDGAMEFYPLMRRWIGDEIDSITVSTPFIYAIERGSILSVQTLEDHFIRLEKRIQDLGSFDYPGGLMQRIERLSEKDYREKFNPEKIAAAYLTPERSIDVRTLAKILRRRLNETSEVSFFPNSKLEAAQIRNNQVEIEFTNTGLLHKKSYDVVVNALWDGRLALDQQMGIVEESTWGYRIKHAIFLKTRPCEKIPTVTLVQGAYGDVVNYGGGLYYLSWYPSCMKGFAKNVIQPPNWVRNMAPAETRQMTSEAIDNLSQYIPSVANIQMDQLDQLSVIGGIIFARGITDVSDRESGLHKRDEPMIKSRGNYYSVNPGKYTLCPRFAYQTANQICEASLPASSI
jgi:glycine/D-amino acid oxidase-like deaminating enzyme